MEEIDMEENVTGPNLYCVLGILDERVFALAVRDSYKDAMDYEQWAHKQHDYEHFVFVITERIPSS